MTYRETKRQKKETHRFRSMRTRHRLRPAGRISRKRRRQREWK